MVEGFFIMTSFTEKEIGMVVTFLEEVTGKINFININNNTCKAILMNKEHCFKYLSGDVIFNDFFSTCNQYAATSLSDGV